MNNRMGCAIVLRNSQDAWVSAISVSFELDNPFLAEILAIECGLNHAWGTRDENRQLCSDCANAAEVCTSGFFLGRVTLAYTLDHDQCRKDDQAWQGTKSGPSTSLR